VSQRIAELHTTVMQIRDVRLQMERIGKRLEGDGKNQAVISAIQETEKKMAGIEQELVQVKMKSSEGNLRYPNMLNESFDTFSHSIENDAAPTAAMLGVFEQLNSQLDAQLAAWKQVVTNDLHSLNAKIQGTDVSSIQVIQPAAE
jgi:seryl-tRNA synthetase